MRAGLERHVERRAARRLASLSKGDSLGVRSSAWRVAPRPTTGHFSPGSRRQRGWEP